MEHDGREYFPDGGLKTDGRCDIPTAVSFNGRPVLGPFSKKCQESTFLDGHTLKSAVFCYFPVDVGRPLITKNQSVKQTDITTQLFLI